jgi:hypothetical protein
MNIESIRATLETELDKYIGVIQVKSFIAQSSSMRGRFLNTSFVVGFEVISSQYERFYTFALETPQGLRFTRFKEGISKHILSEVREHDFYFELEPVERVKHNLVEKLIQTAISSWGYAKINDFINQQCDLYNTGKCATGYKITKHHKDTMTFDGVAEVMINKDGVYKTFSLSFINGVFSRAYEGDTAVTVKHVFS